MKQAQLVNPDDEPVACVIDTEVRIYGPKETHKGVRTTRPLKAIMRFFNNHGQAVQYAREHDDAAKRRAR